MSYAQSDDVAVRLGRPITDANEVAQIEAWLDDVESIIVDGFTRAGLVLADQIVLDDPSVASVIRIEAGAVLRKLQNPSGLTSVTRSIDDASVTERREGSTGDGSLGLSVDDWESLLPNTNQDAFSIHMAYEPDTTVWPDSWL